MKKIVLAIVIIFHFNLFCQAQEIPEQNTIDIALYDSLCPGFGERYRTIQTCKYSEAFNIERSIALLKDVVLQIEKGNGLFDDVNYFEAIRLLCTKYLLTGDYRHIDSVLFASKKFLFENIDNPFDIKDLYKINRVASWIDIRNGKYESAQKTLENVIKEETDSIEYLSALQDLAICYILTEQYDKFTKTAKQSLAISDNLPSQDNTYFFKVTSKKLKAYLYIFSENNIQKGIKTLEDLEQELKNNDMMQRLRCSVLNDLSYLYLDNNQTDNYIQAKREILKNTILSDEEKVDVLESLVGAEWINASDKEIVRHTLMHGNLVKNIAIDNLKLYPATKNIALWPQLMERIDKDSYILNRFPDNNEVCGFCYDNLLFLKNQLLSSDYAIRKYVYQYGDVDCKKLLSEIDSLREYIIYQAANEKYGESYSYDLSFYETDLMKRLPMSKIIDDQIKTWKDISLALKEDEIAIEITDCVVLFPQDSVYSQLMALIVTKNCASPICVKLGNYYEIADELRLLFSGDALNINDVYSTPNNTIYQLLWMKLEKHLLGMKTVYISTNTLLSFVNVGALMAPDGERVSDKYNVRMVSSTAEIINGLGGEQYTNAVLFGGGSFGNQYTADENLYAEVIRAISDRGDFKELTGTIEEVNAIYDELRKRNVQTQRYIGADATERNFRLLNGAANQIIHIATHCFSITDMENSKFLSQLMAIDTRESAMIGTGFILANANVSWNKSAYYKPLEDGILLSEDISRLNLNGCDLLVLSGCQSGKGKVDKDGVYGLQRAFKRAGVKSMLLSLWNVDDNVTKEFMVSFYKSLMLTNNKYTAYTHAQNEIRSKYSNPYYWAAFIMLD